MTAPTASARIFKLCIGLFLMAAGLAVTALLFIPYNRAMETRAWTETPCMITESRMEEYRISELAEPVARVFIKYHYTINNKQYTGTRYQRVTFAGGDEESVTKRTPHFDQAEKLVEKYPVGTTAVCWVNPAAPSEAVLEHHTKAAIYTLWWPMIFAVGGGGIVWSSLRRKKKPLPGTGSGSQVNP
jgi:hypothetical protein